MRQLSLILLSIAAALGGLSSPARAGSFVGRLHGAWVKPSDSLRLGPSAQTGDRVDIGVDGDVGILLAGEYRFGRRFGLDAGALYARLGVHAVTSLDGLQGALRANTRLSLLPVTLGGNVHLAPERGFDLYLGPRFAYVQYGDVTFDFSEAAFQARYTIDRDLAWGGLLGLDVPVGSWSVSAAVLYLPTTARAREVDARIDLDLLVVTLGVARRF